MNATNDYFYCYSPKLHVYLRTRGQRYICAGLNEGTLRKFWQYKRNDELDELLSEWHANNPNK